MKTITGISFILIFHLTAANLKAQNEHCDLSFVLWVEQPSIVKDASYFPDFYSELADFVTCNAARIRFNKVIVRFLNPGDIYGAAGNPWIPSVSSPFLQDLILKLPPDVDVYALPYVKEPQYPWTWMPGNSIEQAVRAISEWNTIINGIDPSRTIKGIVFDPEGSGIGKEDMVCMARTYMPLYGINIKVGLTLAGKAIADAVNWGQLNTCYKVDESYLQIYNLYTKCEGGPIYVDGFDPAGNPCMIGTCTPSPGCGSSIYLEALNFPDPAQTVFDSNPNYNHTFKGILTQEQMNWHLQSIPAGTAKYIYPMFTVEAMINADCMYPNTNDPSKCGQVDGFGTWSAADFLRFVNIFSENIGNMTTLGGENIPKSNYGIFQYAFIPNSWRPCNPSYGCDPLPVQWLEFKATPYSNYVSLQWKTASEKNNDYFSVERSADGKHFYPIGQVAGNGNTDDIISYQFTDPSPLSGISYYRIRQTNVDGSFSFSSVETVNYNVEISIYPNPATDFIEISFHAAGDELYRITLFAADGRMLGYRDVNSTDGQHTFDLSGLADGLYLVRIESKKGVKALKFEKQ